MFHTIGNFGFSKRKGNLQTFPCAFSWSKDSSVTDDIFLWNIKNLICLLYLFADNIEGERVFIKADSDPGCVNEIFLQSVCDHEFCFFYGLPNNGTEVWQKVVLLFAYLKSVIEENRRQLYKQLFWQTEWRVSDNVDKKTIFIIFNENNNDDDDDDDDDDTRIIDVDDFSIFIDLLDSSQIRRINSELPIDQYLWICIVFAIIFKLSLNPHTTFSEHFATRWL